MPISVVTYTTISAHISNKIYFVIDLNYSQQPRTIHKLHQTLVTRILTLKKMKKQRVSRLYKVRRWPFQPLMQYSCKLYNKPTSGRGRGSAGGASSSTSTSGKKKVRICLNDNIQCFYNKHIINNLVNFSINFNYVLSETRGAAAGKPPGKSAGKASLAKTPGKLPFSL